MLDTVMDVLGLEKGSCIMTGDRLYTDIRMALDAGMPSAVVLTGDAKAEDLREGSRDIPDYVLQRIDHLIPAGLRSELGWRDD
jgi:ribonucleotide monophosphatase NagD (HAD superfamily)